MSFIAPWFPAAKLGIFVHWGLFGTMENPDGDHWQKQGAGRGMPEEEYRRRASLFTGEHFEMAEWAALFKGWGAKYAVLTTRHSQGFPLWDTQVEPERSIVSMSPYGKDIVKEWCEGLRAEGLKVGLYFCHRDWYDPDFRAEMDTPDHIEPDPAKRDAAWARFIEKRNAKVRELVNNYGTIDQFWADENWDTTGERLHSYEMVDIIIKNQPYCVLNGRYGVPYVGQISNPEQNIPIIRRGRGEEPFEVCDTLHESAHWQYVPGTTSYKRKEDVLRFFIDTITHGGNYLINIGPEPSGRIPQVEIDLLDYLGDFCRINAEAIYDSWAGLERVYFGGGSTQKKGAIYLFATDKGRTELAFRGVRNPITRVSRLDTGADVPYRLSGGRPSHNAPPYVWIDAAEDSSAMPVVYKVEYEGTLDLCPW